MNNILLYVIIVLIWGSTWIAITFQIGEVAPAVSIVYRFAFAALVLFIYCWMRKVPLNFNVKEHLQLLFFGVALFGTNYYFIYHAQQYINSALTCIACSLILFFNIINARLWFKTAINKQVYIGGLLGIMGISTLFWPQLIDIELGAETLLGFTLCIIGTLFASIGNMLSIKNNKCQLAILPANAWGMFYGSVSMTILAIIQGETFSFSLTVPYVASLLYLSIFGSVIAFGCYLTLLHNIGAHKASYTTIMFPAVAVIISTIVEDFQWSEFTVAGMVFIIFGNIVVLMKPKKKKFNSKEIALSVKVNEQELLIENG
ncbi:DMT family transporter [Colwelliaceae bacterium 6441]